MPGSFTGNKISWEVQDEIGYISLVDPPENRMNSVFFKEFAYVANNIIPVSSASAVIISGSRRHFSSGAALDDLFKVIKQKSYTTLAENYAVFKTLNKLQIPVIAAIRGVCIGAALELALHCHFRLCAEDSILGLPESSFGIIPGLDGISKMMELTGKANTIELVLTGQHFTVRDALKWHIVDEVLPKRIVLEKATQLAKMSAIKYRKYNKRNYLQELKVNLSADNINSRFNR